MVGEIRDKETAEIAIQASLTGHLVFSTLHTNDAAGAVTRLVDMGVEPFLVASLAHRRHGPAPGAPRLPGLPRAVHAHRRRAARSWASLASASSSATAATQIYKARAARLQPATATAAAPASTSCCWSTTTSASWCSKNVDSRHHQEGARSSKGMLTLLEDGARKVALGETTIAEVLSVTQEDI